MSTENIVLMLLFPPPQAVDSSLPVANQGHIQISGTREFDSLFGNLATGEQTRRVQINLIYLAYLIMMCPQLSTPYLATSPQVQKLSDRRYQHELFVSHRKHKKTESHKQKQKHTENWQQDAKFWRSSS